MAVAARRATTRRRDLRMDQHTSSGEVAFRVFTTRDSTGTADRMVWCVARGDREMGRFATAEIALRAAMAYARAALQRGEAASAVVSRARPDGSHASIHLAPFR